jgi:ADP-ribosyl-[dinitrogen reductase] hydrolase
VLDAGRVRGMLLGGALGDALGGPVEFLPMRLIRKKFGPDGITAPVPAADGLAEITDDTQLTLFTLEGLLDAHRAGLPVDRTRLAVHAAYLRWLWTQREEVPGVRLTGRLVELERLRFPRAPGNTCLTALRASARTGPAAVDRPINTSKGCGAVLRAAPCGLWPGDAAEVFRLGADTGALTHSHPSGFLAAGAFAVVVRELSHGRDLLAAIGAARGILVTWPEHDEVLSRVDGAVALAAPRRRPLRRPLPAPRLSPEELRGRLGEGWTAEEALGIALYAALAARDFADGVRLAVNHAGDSDSTGAMAGNLLGAQLTAAALPEDWLARLELRAEITALADQAADVLP